MKNKETEAEYANKKINQVFNGENDNDKLDIYPLLSKNNMSLVIKNQDKNNNDL
jgi:hypothetical protein